MLTAYNRRRVRGYTAGVRHLWARPIDRRRRSISGAHWWAIAMTALFAARSAAAAPPPKRLGLLQIPQTLHEAIEVTLAAWNVEVVAVPSSGGATMPDAATNARHEAADLDLDAAVWISQSDQGAALWIYDAESDRVVARPLAATPPFDEPSAAAVALSVKTLLRHSKLAPVPERYGAAEALAAKPLPTLPAASPARPWGLEALTSILYRDASSAESLEPRFGIGLFFAPLPPHFALFAQVRAGTGVAVDAPTLSARFTDTAFSAGARGLLEPLPNLQVGLQLGGSAHLTQLHGALVETPEAVAIHRVNPSIDLGALASLAATERIRIDAHLDVGLAARRQRYTVNGETALELPSAELELAVVLKMLAN